jgi:hypothetical protein
MPGVDAPAGGKEVTPQQPQAQVKEFKCAICGEPSQHLCAWCTKDACANHLCAKCGRCSDCCECEQVRETSQRPSGEITA